MVMMFRSERVDPVEGGVEGRRLAAAGGSGDEHDAVGPPDQALPGTRRWPLVEADDVSRSSMSVRARQQAHHQALAVGDGDRGEAHVVVAPRNLEPDAPVLGQPLLGDVQAPHDLDAGDDAGHQTPATVA